MSGGSGGSQGGGQVSRPEAGRARALPIRQHGDPVLRTPTDPVRSFDDRLHQLVETMFASMYAAEGVGLAANQIGVGMSVFVVDCDGVVATVVNPRLVETEGELIEASEGCLSAAGWHYPTRRWARAAVEGLDAEGNPIRLAGEGLLARCLQHESDHLEGRLFLDRLRGGVRRQARRDLASGAPPPP